MNDLQAERTTVIAALRLLGLPFEVHTQTIETRGAVRLFLSCDSLGGVLAINRGGRIACGTRSGGRRLWLS